MSKNWKNALALPTKSIREVIKIIDREAMRAAFIVDEKQRLLGMVTDGDIRRGLLRGVTLSDPITEVMNANPQTCTPDESHQGQILKRLEVERLLLIPVVEDGILVNVLSTEEWQAKPRFDNPVFLMAGGFGSRLRPLTDHCPKPMLKVGDKPILQLIVESFIDAGFYRFYFSTHYLPEVIQSHFGDGSKWNIQIEYVHEEQPLGTGGALGLLPESVGELPLIMMNGDLLTRIDFVDLLQTHINQQAIATVCTREFEMQVPYGVLETDSTFLVRMIEKPTYRFNINAGVYVIDSELRRQVARGERIDMPTLLEKTMEAGKRVGTYGLHEYWLDIGMMKDFEKAQSDVRRFWV
ncbi:nucleotidyltransferase family protein [Chitinibacter tainanensis]|uniref:nucleotidyltransferase family protein n=1 Tax=Chitinibacter tainanensis TaxID=230667 RepID=UPI002357E67C|nr:nucleotidyltransferase family protein [Chitinibacter tainanensis]